MIEKGNIVVVHYTGTFEDGQVFDTSVGKEPVRFEVGANQVIEGFENSVIGLTKGDVVDILIGHNEAYGPVNNELFTTVKPEQVPPTVVIGDTLQGQSPDGDVINFIVDSITESAIVLNGNHPLAGKNLKFKIEVVDFD